MSSPPRVHFGASMFKQTLRAPVATGVQATTAGASFAQTHWRAPSVTAQQDKSLHSLSGVTMGTTWSLRLVNADYAPLAPVQVLVQDTLDQVIAQMSNWEEDSHISRFNAAPADSWQVLPPQLSEVLQAALHWARSCDGAWDPTIGALVSLWGFGPRPDPEAAHSGQPPAESAIAQALAVSGYQRLQWQAQERKLWQPGGLQLDLSGIAKGFAVDWVVERLQQAGWLNGLLEIGGELRGWGCRPDGAPWRVAVAGQAVGTGADSELPAEPLVLALRNGAVATSGDHWHVFSHAGQRYSHTLDPRTGRPVAHAMTSVSVCHAQCMHADALATVLTVLGPQAGWEFALTHEVAAVFHTHARPALPQGERKMTPAWTALLP